MLVGRRSFRVSILTILALAAIAGAFWTAGFWSHRPHDLCDGDCDFQLLRLVGQYLLYSAIAFIFLVVPYLLFIAIALIPRFRRGRSN